MAKTRRAITRRTGSRAFASCISRCSTITCTSSSRPTINLRFTLGMQGLGIRLAARLRSILGFVGPLFAERYHARPLCTPREVRHALAYVLGNARKHAAQRGRTMPLDWVDPFSSAPHLAGWSIAIRTNLALCGPPVTLPPRTWLLRIGWARAGPLHPGVIPGGAVGSA